MIDQEKKCNVRNKNKKQAKQKVLPKVEPKRQLEDVLFILTEEEDDQHSAGATTSRHPVMIPSQQQRRQLDINSVWVEMLIHDQQQKTATMAAMQTA